MSITPQDIHIVVVEDEKDILDVIEYNLLREGYKVSVAEDGDTGLRLIRSEHPDLVLLDLMLPELDGIELCRILKVEQSTSDIPVIMVTAKQAEADIIQGLEQGADDYVTKPFRIKELLARVKSVLRRNTNDRAAESSSCLELGPVKIDPEQYSVQLSGKTLELTRTEFRILHTLASKPGRVFSREQLLQDAVGNHVIVLDRNIDVHIRAIRKAFGDHRQLVETVHGVGYRFAGKFD
ncbi:MAG: response regulator transcription factor [Proteobacteria bacterium]|nr:response regulator transcription factor [Pseudomonadota bacterium]